MTREKAFELAIQACKETWNVKTCAEIIKALEQEPCEGAVSRQAVNKLQKYRYNCGVTAITCVSLNSINELPPVTPRQKMGQWIRVDKDKCKCDQCEVISFIGVYPNGDKNYCPNCGAKMVDPQERNKQNG